VYGVRDGIHLLDLAKTRQQLKKAQEIVTKVRREGGDILFVGTKSQSAQRIKERAQASNSVFVAERWLGGILTNWSTVLQSVLELHQLEHDKRIGLWRLIQKKKAAGMKNRMERLERYVGGLKGIRSLPRVVVIVGQTTDFVAAQECRKLSIPLICRLDTDCDPDFADVGVPMNDDSTSRIRLFLEVLLLGIQEGRRVRLSKMY
jgi:small subunit ribosomal protein S2